MSYTLTPEQQISMWMMNVRSRLEDGNIKAALMFLGTLEDVWEKYQRGEPIGPMTIHTGNKMLIEHFEGQDGLEPETKKPRVLDAKCWEFARGIFHGRKVEG